MVWLRTRGLGVLIVASVSAGLPACASEGAHGPLESDTPASTAVAPWVALGSRVQQPSPAAWVGDEHNRILTRAAVRYRTEGVERWSRREKCRWIARTVRLEILAAESRAEARAHWQRTSIDPVRWAKSTTSLGCQAADLPPAPFSAPLVGPAFTPAEGDTVEYFPTQRAEEFFAQIEAALYSTNSPTEYDNAVALMVAQAMTEADEEGPFYDAEAVYAVASTAVSSAYYWQGEVNGGSGPSDPWGGEFETAPPSGAAGLMASGGDDVVRIVGGDLLGCATGFWGGRSLIWGVFRKIVIPGSVWGDCLFYGAVGSIAMAM